MEAGFASGAIIFDDPRAIYYSGQVLSGRVEFRLTETLIFSTINIMYCGEAKVLWQEYEIQKYNGTSQQLAVKFFGHQNYFQFIQTVCGGTGTFKLNPGTHAIPFKYQIPHIAPSSFNGEKGKVIYYVVVYVEYPEITRKRDEITKEFTVIAPLDLNKGSPRIREPIDMELEEVYSCSCFCEAKPVSVKVCLPVSGYCPGQDIPITVQVDNQTAFEVKEMVFQLIEKVRYRSLQPPSEFTAPQRMLSQSTLGPILRATRKQLTCMLPVPDMIAVNLENCSLIDVGYFLKATVKLSGCNDNMYEECEICLGLVPLASTVSGAFSHPLQRDLPRGAIPDPAHPPPIVDTNLYPSQPVSEGPSAPPLEATPIFTSMNFSEFGFNITVNSKGFNISQ